MFILFGFGPSIFQLILHHGEGVALSISHYSIQVFFFFFFFFWNCKTDKFLGFVSVQNFGLQEIQKEIVLLLSTAVIVTAALNSSYSTSQPQGTR